MAKSEKEPKLFARDNKLMFRVGSDWVNVIDMTSAEGGMEF
jgi:hypothetical protein